MAIVPCFGSGDGIDDVVDIPEEDGDGGKATRGTPRNTVDIPAALPICEATWSAVMEFTGRAERVR